MKTDFKIAAVFLAGTDGSVRRRLRIDYELPVVGMLLLEVVLRLHLRIAVLDHIR